MSFLDTKKGKKEIEERQKLSDRILSISVLDKSEAYTKTRKIVPVLVMLADLFPAGDTAGKLIRENALNLLSDTFEYSEMSVIERRVLLLSALRRLEVILSVMDVQYVNNKISKMNMEILYGKVINVHNLTYARYLELGTEKKDNSKEEKVFDILSGKRVSIRSALTETAVRKMKMKERDKTIKKIIGAKQEKKALSSREKTRRKRQERIIEVLKDFGKEGASIADLAQRIHSLSEKTIYREVDDLIENKIVIMKGEKRWRKYFLKK